MSEVVIVGGGLAGGAAAALLARRGMTPLVLERESEPRDKLCGEFLSAEAVANLSQLGLDLSALGAAHVDRLRFAVGRRTLETRLPFAGLGLTRRRLDAALLDHARSLGARVERGVMVRGASAAGLQTDQGALAPDIVLLASGKHEVRGLRRDKAGAIRGMIGFKTHFRLSAAQRAALAGHVEVVLFEGGYAGLMPVEGGMANLCLLVGPRRFEAAGRRWPALLASLLEEPHLGRRLGDGEQLGERPLTIADVPYGFVHCPRAGDPDSLFRLGDQAAVIPSFAGDGMSIALHSGRLAARAVLAGAGAGAYHARLRADVGRQVALATLLQRLSDLPLGRQAVFAGLRRIPRAMSLLATWTRVPDAALRRAGMAV